jgi:hypothetical protein
MLPSGRLMVALQPLELVCEVVPPGHSALSNTPPLLLLTVNVKSTVPQQTPLPTQLPPEQLSEPLQAWPSVQAEPFGSAAVQLSAPSLHDSEQFPSPSAPGHGFPAWTVQAPATQVSAPLQNRPSLHGALLFGCVQLPAPLQMSFVQTFPSDVHGVPFE